MKTNLFVMILAILSLPLLSFDNPMGWKKTGSKPKCYDMGIDKGAGLDGQNAATIQSIEDNINGFGTLMQACQADNYSGKRIRMTGYMRSENVAEWAGFWLRVDQLNPHKPLAFDNMKNRAITGTTGWRKYEIVLDVPSTATGIAYGALLSGTRQIWFDNLKFEIVNSTVPKTGYDRIGEIDNTAPFNLNFEEQTFPGRP